MAAKKNVKKLICWNVNGIRAVEKKGFVKLVTELNADIFSIQETKAQPDQLSEQLHNIEGYNPTGILPNARGTQASGYIPE